ncbi:hypothetical protein M514_06554 [Trichuris suis]|nr:hypothetical protein M514_06554 [Trichuris suis]
MRSTSIGEVVVLSFGLPLSRCSRTLLRGRLCQCTVRRQFTMHHVGKYCNKLTKQSRHIHLLSGDAVAPMATGALHQTVKGRQPTKCRRRDRSDQQKIHRTFHCLSPATVAASPEEFFASESRPSHMAATILDTSPKLAFGF